jgi:hypothetical protein
MKTVAIPYVQIHLQILKVVTLSYQKGLLVKGLTICQGILLLYLLGAAYFINDHDLRYLDREGRSWLC